MIARLNTPAEAARWLHERVSGSLSTDSRKVQAGDGFIAWPGAATDARRYIDDILASGAQACLMEEEGSAPYGFDDARVAAYPGLKAAAAPIAAAYFEEPSRRLNVIAVTGTNGKTSTTWWLAQALKKAGSRCGVVGTLGIGEPDAMVFNGLTTPDPVLLQQQFRRFVDEGFTACALEASSIGIEELRLDATQVRVAVFTNFTQDHLDYHGSMAAYWAAKQRLFAWPGLKAAVLNVDDEKGVALNGMLQDCSLDVWTVSINGPARLRATQVSQSAAGTAFDVLEGDEKSHLFTSAVGLYNVSNLLGVVAAMRALGIPLDQAVKACEGLLPVPGRLETLAQEGLPMVAIDYAHTPDALEKVLTALKPVAQGRGGQLWCVFGCGGNRDAAKRPLMAAVAQAQADRLLVTSDNPRHEAPEFIINQILQGLAQREGVQVESDRAMAISLAISQAQSSDVILLAGKGHEDYQDVMGVKHPFSDRRHAETALGARTAMTGAAS